MGSCRHACRLATRGGIIVLFALVCGSGRSQQAPSAAGIYDFEKQIVFNVLDRLEYNPATGQILLMGHLDNRYKTPAIPYIQHLATLLDSPAPEFSLNWTRDSEAQVDALLRRMDSLDEMRRMAGEWGKWLDDRGNVTATGRSFMSQLGIQPTGGSWDTADRYSVVASIFRAAGNQKAANLIEFLRKTQATASQDDFQTGLVVLFIQTGKIEAYRDMVGRARSGEISESQLLDQMFRLIAQSLDEGLGLSRNPALSAYDTARRRGTAAENAFDTAVVAEVNRQIPAVMYSAMESLFNRPDEMVVPPEVLAATLHVRPEMVPEFIDVDAHSQLARVLFEADYLTKSLFNRPELRNAIPRYQTEFAFERDHPVARTSSATAGRVADCRIWITVDGVDVAQSPNGNVLATRAAALRFNMREKTGSGTTPAACPREYAALLTSLYDDIAVEYPALHELREAAKLAAVAHWLKGRMPGLILPQGGRTEWNAPATVPGLLYVMWSPKPPKPGAPVVSMHAEGGVSLRLPAGPVNIPTDPQLTPDATTSKVAPQFSSVALVLPGGSIGSNTSPGAQLKSADSQGGLARSLPDEPAHMEASKPFDDSGPNKGNLEPRAINGRRPDADRIAAKLRSLGVDHDPKIIQAFAWYQKLDNLKSDKEERIAEIEQKLTSLKPASEEVPFFQVESAALTNESKQLDSDKALALKEIQKIVVDLGVPVGDWGDKPAGGSSDPPKALGK